jgi:hypothetical protein
MTTENDDYLVERLVPKVLSAIRAKSRAVESLSVKKDLSGITSLPAYDTTGGQFKTVLVELETFRKPSADAADAANKAAKEANDAALAVDEVMAEFAEWKDEINLKYNIYDGGRADSVYGGSYAIDCGNANNE